MQSLISDWLSKRKITPEIQSVFDVQERNGSIEIPVHDFKGTVVFSKHRRSPLKDDGPKYWYDKGAKAMLYGFWKAKECKEILICEGELDCLVAWSHNIPAVSSTGGAGTWLPEWTELMKDKNIVICYDNDQAGGEGMARVLMQIPNAKVLFLPDSPGIKDLSDYAEKAGNLHELIKTAKEFPSMESIFADRAVRLATWHSTFFHDAYIHMKDLESRPKKTMRLATRTSGDEVERARQYPIIDITGIVFNAAGFARCPFHNEKTASLKYYSEDNHCYCFGGCGRAYDSIDIYRKINGSTFKEAVKALQ